MWATATEQEQEDNNILQDLETWGSLVHGINNHRLSPPPLNTITVEQSTGHM